MAHETGHTFGLPDLYHFGEEGLHRYVGTFGLMGDCAAKAPGYFAFERWVLGWIDDHQIYCHEAGEVVVALDALETVGGTKAIMVPIDSITVLAVESRKKIGFDQHIPKEGALVYLVHTDRPGGSGPIQVKPGATSDDQFLQDAPMAKGEQYTYKNISIEVVESHKNGDEVKVLVK